MRDVWAGRRAVRRGDVPPRGALWLSLLLISVTSLIAAACSLPALPSPLQPAGPGSAAGSEERLAEVPAHDPHANLLFCRFGGEDLW